ERGEHGDRGTLPRREHPAGADEARREDGPDDPVGRGRRLLLRYGRARRRETVADLAPDRAELREVVGDVLHRDRVAEGAKRLADRDGLSVRVHAALVAEGRRFRDRGGLTEVELLGEV